MKPRSPRRSTRRSGARSNTGNDLELVRAPARGDQQRDIDRLATSLVASVNALASVVKAQSLEMSDLRQRLEGVRSLLN